MFLPMLVASATALAVHPHEHGTRVDFVRGTRVQTSEAFTGTLERFLAE
jgi:hypothetical protein